MEDQSIKFALCQTGGRLAKVLSFSLLLQLSYGTPCAASAPRISPNIVVLLADDLGWGDVHYRREKLEWPNLEQFMRDGVTFPNAYAAVPTCSPCRASVLTGQHAAKLRLVRHIYSPDRFGRNTEPFSVLAGDPAQMPSRNWLPLEEITYAEALKPLVTYP